MQNLGNLHPCMLIPKIFISEKNNGVSHFDIVIYKLYFSFINFILGVLIIMENNSVNEVPEAVKGWNWGAFMFNMSWGLGNKSYLPLLVLLPIPVFGFIWAIFCGALGNGWAWKKSGFQNTPEDIATFKQIQDTWNRAGLWMFIIVIASIIVTLIFVGILGAIAANQSY